MHGESYIQLLLEILHNFLEPRLNKLGNVPLWFQLDGAITHMAMVPMEVLKDFFRIPHLTT